MTLENVCSRHTSYHFRPLAPNQWPFYRFPLETYFLQSDQSRLRKPTQRTIESFLKHWFMICDIFNIGPQYNTDIIEEPHPPQDWVLLNVAQLERRPTSPLDHPDSEIHQYCIVHIVHILYIYCIYIVHILYIYCTYIVYILYIYRIYIVHISYIYCTYWILFMG